jgi:N-acetylmuramoyl-L-alanine amidase
VEQGGLEPMSCCGAGYKFHFMLSYKAIHDQNPSTRVFNSMWSKMQKKLLFVVFLVAFSQRLFSGSFSDFDAYQGCLTQDEVALKVEHFLQKDADVSDYYTLSKHELKIFNLPKNHPEAVCEYVLSLAEKGESKSALRGKKDFIGLKVALDPGHLGGRMAYLEERFVSMESSEELGENPNLSFNEGTLTFLTALYLKELLEGEGAEVMLTRDAIGHGAYPSTFFEWLEKMVDPLFERMSLSKIFRTQYNLLDLRARAKKINDFSPDLTLVIHYNAHESESKEFQKTKATSQNFSLTFVPGAFCQGELNSEQARYEFIRLVVTDAIDQSLVLGQCIQSAFVQHLEVPPLMDESAVKYIARCCLKVGEGVYARNLALTRCVHGPVAYGESLLQNNLEECKRLCSEECSIQGIPCSCRVKQVAEAYFEGIKAYLKSI